MNKIFKIVAVFIIIGFFHFQVKAQVSITTSHSAASMAQMLAGAGVTISNAFYNGTCDSSIQSGKFFVTGTTPLGLDSGIILTSGSVLNAAGASAVPSTSYSNAGDADLAILSSPQSSNDACVLEFDFVPKGDTVKFKYVFGSAEYQNYSCFIADVFGFFISGPGITGPFSNNATNVALLPNGCYVGVNTVNGQTSNPCGNASGTCAPPNNALFYSNLPIGNTVTGVAYNGFTVPMYAIATVTPCSTYHLKLAVSDASDWILDSGVFLEAGSLSSNSIAFTPFSLLSQPDPYLVEGCAPGGVVVSRPVAAPTAYVVNYNIGGTATNGVDYQALSGSVTIPPNQTSATIAIIPLTDALIEGTETITIFKQAACDTVITDSVTFEIYDNLRLKILTSDTTICLGKSVNIITEADTNLSFMWTPNQFINNDTLQNPTVSPINNGYYIVSATLPNSGCAPVKDTIQIDINPGPVVNIGPDITICKNMVHNFNPTVTPQQTYTYNWLPPASTAFLNSSTILNPTGTFTNVGVYPFVLVASPLAAGCNGFDTMTVTVLPNDFVLTNQDTTICDGESVQVTIVGPNQFTYTWSPGAYVSNTGIKNPIITTPVPNTYNCTATYPGCPDMNHSFHINIEPIPQVSVGPDRTKCYYDTLRLEGIVLPDTFSQYIYAWTPTTNLNNSNTANVVFSGTTSTTYTLNVSTPIGCKGSDAVAITVFPKNLTTLFPSDTNMCPGNSVTLRANGAVSYLYQPGIFIADSTAAITIATPITEQTYTLYSIDANGCPDTDYAHIFVPDNAILNLGPDVTLYPGDDHQFNAFTNCSNFLWTPPSFLNYTNISNPTISNPTSSIQYTVLASNEFGCTTSDTITVYVIDESVITLPNAFSPGNGSSTNDNLKVQHLGNATLNHFRIFNRWGQLVFETTNINQGWNGRYNDVPQPMGTYVYQLQATSNKGKIINKQGNITLIR